MRRGFPVGCCRGQSHPRAIQTSEEDSICRVRRPVDKPDTWIICPTDVNTVENRNIALSNNTCGLCLSQCRRCIDVEQRDWLDKQCFQTRPVARATSVNAMFVDLVVILTDGWNGTKPRFSNTKIQTQSDINDKTHARIQDRHIWYVKHIY